MERREVPSSAAADVVMLDATTTDATTTDSKNVTVDYRVDNAPETEPFTVGVYRSADSSFDAGDSFVGSEVVNPSTMTDASDAPAGSLGTHKFVIPLPGSLPPDPAKPYVLAVVNPSSGSVTPSETASFRTYILGVVVHGGIQETTNTPVWEYKVARELRQVGYDKVIPFSWAGASTTPGQAVKQGPKLAAVIRKASEEFPAGSVVDLHIIAHSEGAVVTSQALLGLQHNTTPQLQAGYLKVTLLDPHAANNNIKTGLDSVASGLNGQFARLVIRSYQALSHDPPVVIPDNVDWAEEYYQRTPVQVDGANNGLYNLFGQAPLKGVDHYVNLTGPGIAHTGGKGVQVWYYFHVIPTLRDGGNTIVDPTLLTAQRVSNAPGGPLSYTGKVQAGSKVTVIAERPNGRPVERLGRAVADSQGDWSITGTAPPTGTYRIVARAIVPEGLPAPRAHFFPSINVETLTLGG